GRAGDLGAGAGRGRARGGGAPAPPGDTRGGAGGPPRLRGDRREPRLDGGPRRREPVALRLRLPALGAEPRQAAPELLAALLAAAERLAQLRPPPGQEHLVPPEALGVLAGLAEPAPDLLDRRLLARRPGLHRAELVPQGAGERP